jgi:hypothetical protein
MAHDARATVFVSPAGALSQRPRLFGALAEAFPLSFEDWVPGRTDGAGLIAVGPPGALPPAAELPEGLPTLAVAGSPDIPAGPRPFTLESVADVDRRVRGLTLTDRFSAPPCDDTATGGHQVLATSGSEAVWTVSHRPAPLHRLRSELPELQADEVLYALLGRRQLTTVALVQFLRELSGPARWAPAPLRAAFLFDDPNLRWRSYGYIDYQRLVRHADEHGYHAAMAMIPLDAGRPHVPTVELFRRRADRLSLIVHGNDHTKGELLATADDATAQTVAAQAVRRIQRFEQRAGLPVDRVMAPPHGLCSQPMTRALGAVGFDALTAIHPLPWTETPPADPLLAGWRAADFVAGCPVVPRIPLGSSAADIGLRAFLDHPLVVYGHHEDVASGLDALAETAAMVNRLGDVSWTSVGEIVTSNAERRRRGNRLDVRPLARRVLVRADPELSVLVVQAPEDSIDASALSGFAVRDLADASAFTRTAAFGDPVSLAPAAGRRLEITLHGPTDVEPGLVPQPTWRPWPKLRRVVTEIRDRAIVHTSSGARSVAGTDPDVTREESQRWAA